VVVTGVEAQALFNWLINCRSTVSNTGPHAGIPPTLLAPVAFTGATLTPLKVRIPLLLYYDSFKNKICFKIVYKYVTVDFKIFSQSATVYLMFIYTNKYNFY